jgi:hypothetical protein
MTSKPRQPASSATRHALVLAAGCWAELGVSGWTASHGNWAIDPEPLIIFTAWLGDRDPRLRDEATDWCIRNWRHISKARLKTLLQSEPPDTLAAFGEFAATVGKHAGVTWPNSTSARRYTVTGRSNLPSLDRPSLAWLRIRSTFGLSTRAEILRCLLSTDGALTVRALAAATAYTKRNVADECESLQQGGVLAVRQRGNTLFYSLARREHLEAFVGALPSIRPNWSAVFSIAKEFVLLEEDGPNISARTVPIRVKKMLRSIEEDLVELDLDPPSDDLRGADLEAAVRVLQDDTIGNWSIGTWAK